VASALVGTCAQGAWMNVMINLQDLKDIERKENYRTQVEALLSTVLNRVEEQSASVQEFLRTNL
jgi:formiminotetrahydrofolate cyclodeaminase